MAQTRYFCTLLFCGLLASFSSTQAQSAQEPATKKTGHYVSFGLASVSQKPDKDLTHSDWGSSSAGFNHGQTFSVQDLVIKLGGEISEQVFGELRISKTVSSKTAEGVEYQYDYHLMPTLRLGRQLADFHPYVFLGYGFGKRSVTSPQRTGSSHLSSPAYGLGLDYNLTATLGLNLEYAHLYPTENIAPAMWQGGVFLRFK
jgi:opacity protein-like surface antigen